MIAAGITRVAIAADCRRVDQLNTCTAHLLVPVDVTPVSTTGRSIETVCDDVPFVDVDFDVVVRWRDVEGGGSFDDRQGAKSCQKANFGGIQEVHGGHEFKIAYLIGCRCWDRILQG